MNKRMTKLILEGFIFQRGKIASSYFSWLLGRSNMAELKRFEIFMREISLKTIKNNGFMVMNYN